MEEALSRLSDNKKLVRDAAVERLESLILSCPDNAVFTEFEQQFNEKICVATEVTWEAKHGFLSAARCLVTAKKVGLLVVWCALRCVSLLLIEYFVRRIK